MKVSQVGYFFQKFRRTGMTNHKFYDDLKPVHIFHFQDLDPNSPEISRDKSLNMVHAKYLMIFG